MKAKIFAALPGQVEELLNQWLADFQPSEIVSVTQSTNSPDSGYNGDIYLTIIYKP